MWFVPEAILTPVPKFSPAKKPFLHVAGNDRDNSDVDIGTGAGCEGVTEGKRGLISSTTKFLFSFQPEELFVFDRN